MTLVHNHLYLKMLFFFFFLSSKIHDKPSVVAHICSLSIWKAELRILMPLLQEWAQYSRCGFQKKNEFDSLSLFALPLCENTARRSSPDASTLILHLSVSESARSECSFLISQLQVFCYSSTEQRAHMWTTYLEGYTMNQGEGKQDGGGKAHVLICTEIVAMPSGL